MNTLITTNRISLELKENNLEIKRYSHTNNKGEDRFNILNIDFSKGYYNIINEIDSSFEFDVYSDELMKELTIMIENNKDNSIIKI